jgi:metal-dependent amidase/aminoacylase/carboxypeptidase family protein
MRPDRERRGGDKPEEIKAHGGIPPVRFDRQAVLFQKGFRIWHTSSTDFSIGNPCSPGAFINIGNAGTVGSCPVHNPHYDFNDAALPIGANLFARLVEKKLARLSDQAGPLYL